MDGLHEETTDDANAWVAEFAPLVMDDPGLTVPEIKERLALVEKLRTSVPDLQKRLDSLENPDDDPLATTFVKAASQLDSLESDYRKRLGKLAPGDPLGIADLGAVQDKLAERAARQELGVATDQEIPAVLELKTGAGNLAGAAFMGIFGLGWTSFTTLHAIFMIGGMMQAVGPAALFMLLFYSIFFAVGFGMLAGAFLTAATENIRLEGHKLTVTRKLGPITRSKSYEIAAGTKANIGEPEQSSTFRQANSKPGPAILLSDVNGRPVTLATTAMTDLRVQIRDQINAYLASQE